MTGDNPKPDADMLARVEASLNLSLAQAGLRNDLALADRGGDVVGLRVINFELAAASAGVAELPSELPAMNNPAIRISFSEVAGAINARVEALGFTAIETVQHRFGRLVSVDGAVDYTFRFDQRGRGQVQLSGSDTVRQSLLSGFRIEHEA